MKTLVRCLLGSRWLLGCEKGALQGMGFGLGITLDSSLASPLLSYVMLCFVFGIVHSSLKLITYIVLFYKSLVLD